MQISRTTNVGVFPFLAAGSIWLRQVSAGAFRRTRKI